MKRRNRLTAAGLFVCILALAALLSACGSSGGSSSSDTESSASGAETASNKEAGPSSKIYEEFSAPITWPGPEEPVTPPSGKSITVIICGSQGITCVRVGEGAEAAAKAAGYEVNIIDGQGTPTGMNQAMANAISSKTDGIVLAAVPPNLVTGAFEKAQAAGIKIAATLSIAGPPADVRVGLNRKAIAKANAAWIGQDSGGGAHVLLLRDGEFPETEETAEAYPAAFEADCSGCNIEDEAEFTLALASQRLAGEVAQTLRTHPEINYIIQPFDTVTTFVNQGIVQAGKSGQVKIVGLGADPPSFEAMKEGTMAESLGTAAQWMGWDAVDGLIRTFAGKPVPKLNSETDSNYDVPERYVTPEDGEPGPAGWPDFDYQSKFEELWGK